MSAWRTALGAPPERAIAWHRSARPTPSTVVDAEFARLTLELQGLGVRPERVMRVDASGSLRTHLEPALAVLEGALGSGRVTHLAVSSLDRLARDPLRVARILRALARGNAALVISGQVVAHGSDMPHALFGLADTAAPVIRRRRSPSGRALGTSANDEHMRRAPGARR